VVLLTSLAAVAGAQEHREFRQQTFGPVSLIEEGGEVSIRYQGREWKLDWSQLPVHANDCPHTQTSPGPKAGKYAARLACIQGWQRVAWDEPRHRLFLAVWLDTSQNSPKIIFSYGLQTRRFTRMVNDFGGGYDADGIVGSSGRYLALVSGTALGFCSSFSGVKVVDTWDRRLGSFSIKTGDADEVPRVKDLKWSGPGALEYTAEIHRDSECAKAQGEPTPVRNVAGSIALKDVKFH
jgi:hypothetical protein